MKLARRPEVTPSVSWMISKSELVRCFCRLFRIGIRPEVNAVPFTIALNRDPGLPFRSVFIDTRKTRPIHHLFAVLHVFTVGCRPKIGDTIIRWVAVYVIQPFVWLMPIDVNPRNAMGKVKAAFYFDSDVPLTFSSSGHARISSVPPRGVAFRTWPFFPPKGSGFRFVIQQCLQGGLRWHTFWLNHAGRYSALLSGLMRYLPHFIGPVFRISQVHAQ